MTTVAELIKASIDLRANPAAVKRVIYGAIDHYNTQSPTDAEYDVLSVAAPFPFCIEAITATSCAALVRGEVVARKLYPSLSQTMTDLYGHMSDEDYKDRFDTPGQTVLTIMVPAQEIRQAAVADGGIRKVTIPRDSFFRVDNIVLSLQYPIDIRVMPHGAIQVMYDNERPSPIQTLESNIVDSYTFIAPEAMAAFAGQEIVAIQIPLLQFNNTSYADQMNISTGFNKTYTLTDKFFYARVYHRTNTEDWVEMYTTHSDQVYDENRVTAVLRVIEGQINVRIPQVYLTKGLVKSNIRVDIYTTLGDVTVNLQRYSPGMFDVTWNDLSALGNNYVNAWRAIPTKTYFSDSVLTGGTNGLTFEELRDQVIYGALGNSQKKSFRQLELDLAERDYQLIRHVDNLTNRVFLATKALPAPNSTIVNSPMGVVAKTLQATYETIASAPTVIDVGDKLVMKSGSLFTVEDGVLRLVSQFEIDRLTQLQGDSLINEYSTKDYYYNPFHMVLDLTDNEFTSRAYYMDKPSIARREFIRQNETLQLQLASGALAVEKTSYGYRLVIATISGDIVKAMADTQVHAQLLFKPRNDVSYAGVNGTLLAKTAEGERVYEFKVVTDFDINTTHQLAVKNFFMADTAERNFLAELITSFELIFSVSDYNVTGMTRSEIDTVSKYFLLPETAYGVVQERLTIQFGRYLDYLWNRSRVVVGSGEPRRYTENIPKVWEKTVYLTDERGFDIVYYDEATGKLSRQVVHNQGDVVLDSNGHVVFEHQIGDIKYDDNGNVVYEHSRSMMVQVDVVLFEGLFTITTDAAANTYRDDSINTLVAWVTTEIPRYNRDLLENTKLWYTPKTTAGDIRVRVKEGVITTIDSRQNFSVAFYLTEENLKNLDLREPLTRLARTAIAKVLQQTTIRVNDIVSEIRNGTTTEIIDVLVTGLGGIDNNFEIVTVVDVDSKVNLAKSLTLLGDGTISIIDGVIVEFLPHQEQINV